MNQPPKNRILTAIEALQAFDRGRAAALLADELRTGPPSGERWKSVARLAAQIGEIDLALEASHRFASTMPASLERLLLHWGNLAAYDRTDEARAEIERVPAGALEHPSVQHFLGTIAGQDGDFVAAEAHYRQALAQSPMLPQSWFALAMIKTFAPGDPDLARMEQLRPRLAGSAPELEARFLYGLAKAWHDCADYERAWACYAEGAALRRSTEQWAPAALESYAASLIRDFTAEAARQLTPVAARPRRALFVNGLPRSGTTLVEQILASHSQVVGAGEVNLLRAALIDTGDHTLAGALAYQQRFPGADPWGALAEDYARMMRMRFRSDGLVVDKTLGHSHYMGLLLHMLPDARVIWLRRDPEDVALSCFRNYFTAPIAWSWSLTDIARFFRVEDRLFAHWTEHFGERILVVPYELMVRDPEPWIERILAHAGLSQEPQVRDFRHTRRSVRTASVSQVRQPITTDRIGLSQAYREPMAAFRAAYFG